MLFHIDGESSISQVFLKTGDAHKSAIFRHFYSMSVFQKLFSHVFAAKIRWMFFFFFHMQLQVEKISLEIYAYTNTVFQSYQYIDHTTKRVDMHVAGASLFILSNELVIFIKKFEPLISCHITVNIQNQKFHLIIPI